MKQNYKSYLSPEDHKKLLEKAEQRGISGRGAFSQFLSMLAREDFLFLNKDSEMLLKMLNLSVG